MTTRGSFYLIKCWSQTEGWQNCCTKATRSFGRWYVLPVTGLPESEKSSFYRQKLGISDEKPVISFFGSWNRESLFHVLGENLFQVCDALKGTYTFIFSIHPREYKTYDKEINPMGEQVERQREKGHMVRSPSEDWIPYIMASDVVVSDYSTMMSLAILAGKKVMLSDFPDEKIGVYSLGYQVKKTFPVLKDASELEDALKQVLELPVFDQMVEQFRQELYVSVELSGKDPGCYKRNDRQKIEILANSELSML